MLWKRTSKVEELRGCEMEGRGFPTLFGAHLLFLTHAICVIQSSDPMPPPSPPLVSPFSFCSGANPPAPA